MQDYRNLIDIINQNIKRNGNQHITGDLMNSILKLIINFAVDVNQGFNGILKPNTPAKDITGFWVATAGNYPNFNTIINDNQLGFIYYDNTQGRYITEKVDLVNLEAIKDYVDTRLINANIGFGGEITSLNQQPSVEGMYIPTIDGTYPNFGNLTYDSEVDGLSIFVYKNEEFSKINVPLNIQLSNIVEYGSNKAVTSNAVEKFAVKKINNISELRNTQGEYEGQLIELLGYYEAGEYSLKYKWSNTQGVDDGGSIINTGSGRWEAIFDTYLNVRYYGVRVGTDDTLLIQRALDKASELGLTTVFNEGEYLIDGTVNVNRGILIPSKSKVLTSMSTVFKVIQNNSTNYACFSILESENIYINRLNCLGERNDHIGVTGEWGYGLYLIRSKNVTIDYLECKDFWGDGLCIGGSLTDRFFPNENIIIKEYYADNNRRQGISIGNVDGLTINRAIIKNTNGTAPSAGIDFEPNGVYGKLRNIRIKELNSYNNNGGGVIFVPQFMSSESDFVSITIDIMNSYNERAFNSGDQLESKINGYVNFGTINSFNSPTQAVEIRKAFNTVDFNIDTLNIFNCNQSNLSADFGVGLRICQDSVDVYYPERVYSKIFIRNINVSSSDNKMHKAVLVREYNRPNETPVINFSFDSIYIKENVYDKYPILNTIGKIGYINDMSPISSITLSRTSRSPKVITNINASSTLYITSNPYYIGYSFTIKCEKSLLIGITATNNFKIFGFENLEGHILTSQTIGSTVTLEYVRDNVWKITHIEGVWNMPGGLTSRYGNIQASDIYFGSVKKSIDVGNITIADATDLATSLVLVNELKAKLNAKLTADRNSGQQAT